MIDARLLVDDAVGETRRVLVDSTGRAFRADVECWSEREQRVRVGETWAARLVERTPDGDWFVDLGSGGQGVLRAARAGELTAGARVSVKVKIEPHVGKGAVVDIQDRGSAPDVGGRLAEAHSDPFLKGVRVNETLDGGEARRVVSAVLEEADSKTVGLSDGGALSIEQTRAVCAIDVDRGASTRRVADINLGAADEAARQVALRGVGGVVIVDFIGAPRSSTSKELADRFEKQVRNLAGCRVDNLGLSRFGLLQASLGRGRRSLADAVRRPADEREALDALRAIETLGWAHRGARIDVTMSTGAERWLRTSLSSWEADLGDRIGWRWRLTTVDRPVGAADIRIME